jgi:hypothetical protein
LPPDTQRIEFRSSRAKSVWPDFHMVRSILQLPATISDQTKTDSKRLTCFLINCAWVGEVQNDEGRLANLARGDYTKSLGTQVEDRMGFDLNELRNRADAVKRRSDAARPHEELLRKQAEGEARRNRQEMHENEQKRIAGEAERKLKQALDEAASKGSREASIWCSKSDRRCGKQDVGSFFTLLSHVHDIGCMDEVIQAVWERARALGLSPKMERRVNWDCGYGGHSVGMHSDTCVSYTIKIRF